MMLKKEGMNKKNKAKEETALLQKKNWQETEENGNGTKASTKRNQH